MDTPLATAPDRIHRLTAYSHGAGCACKLGMADLAEVLGSIVPPSHPDLLVGRDAADDALVWRRPDGRALVATVDVFTPIVDDAATWGRVAAVNAVSDVYAMGGTPLFALAIAAWPREQLPLDLLAAVLGAGQQAATDGGWVVAGGHTIDGAEPLYGQAVIGEVDADRILTNAGGRPGDVLVLTKALGTGLVTTAVKRRGPEATEDGNDLAEAYQAAVASMTTTNAAASALAVETGATAATDVTGFGLLGHLRSLGRASGVGAEVVAPDVPHLPGLAELLAAGEVPGGTRRNLDAVRPDVVADGIADDDLVVLADAQTSGGLLVALPPDAADEFVTTLRTAHGAPAAIIGQLTDGGPGTVLVRS